MLLYGEKSQPFEAWLETGQLRSLKSSPCAILCLKSGKSVTNPGDQTRRGSHFKMGWGSAKQHGHAQPSQALMFICFVCPRKPVELKFYQLVKSLQDVIIFVQ